MICFSEASKKTDPQIKNLKFFQTKGDRAWNWVTIWYSTAGFDLYSTIKSWKNGGEDGFRSNRVYKKVHVDMDKAMLLPISVAAK